jgi:hypothetical protein
MVKVKIINTDNTSSTYDVTYARAYVEKVISEEKLRGKDPKVKEIYVNENKVAELISNVLTRTDWRQPNKNTPAKPDSNLVTIEIPTGNYWVSTSTDGLTTITYIANLTK